MIMMMITKSIMLSFNVMNAQYNLQQIIIEQDKLENVMAVINI